MAEPTDVQESIRGGLLGVACGDALGATTEFESRPRPPERRVTEIVGGGALRWRPGQPTDDTDLTLAVLRATVAAVASAMVDGATVAEAMRAPRGRSTVTPEVDAVLGEDPTGPMPFQPGGWVLTALRLACWAVRQDAPAADLLLDVINQGGDADTNGAIVGGLLGCRDGASAWPRTWVDALETRDELMAAAVPLASLRLGRSAPSGGAR